MFLCVIFCKVLFDFNGVARNVFATLTQEEPNKDEDGTAENKQAVFSWIGPAGGKEDEGVDDA